MPSSPSWETTKPLVNIHRFFFAHLLHLSCKHLLGQTIEASIGGFFARPPEPPLDEAIAGNVEGLVAAFKALYAAPVPE